MTKSKYVVQARTYFGIMAIVSLLFYAAECHSFPYRPASAVSILSEYTASKTSVHPHTQIWQVVSEGSPDGTTTLLFYLEAQPGEEAICQLVLPPFRKNGEIRWKGIGHSEEKKSESELFLMPGFPAPCDILPVGENVEERVYQQKSSAGGSVFSQKYHVSAVRFSSANARANGWIKDDAFSSILDLIMVTVADDRGRLTVRQLWSESGSWWLYEETPERRSWSIY